ncbi:vpu protein [Human immunodeficiency virus 1]|uniref:Protein Vpu n=1 Tax=Human immunodeficiency virus type 1 TaxID=11676 RepID=A0A1S6KJI1_HV1|nr:vpu protein [Human immunodeficiency virus 1]
MLLPLGLTALGVALILAVVVWVLLYKEYKKLKLQEQISYITLRDREEDSGNESDGDTELLVTLLSCNKLEQGSWV